MGHGFRVGHRHWPGLGIWPLFGDVEWAQPGHAMISLCLRIGKGRAFNYGYGFGFGRGYYYGDGHGFGFGIERSAR